MKCTKNNNSRAQLVFCSWNLLFSDITVTAAAGCGFLISSLLSTICLTPFATRGVHANDIRDTGESVDDKPSWDNTRPGVIYGTREGFPKKSRSEAYKGANLSYLRIHPLSVIEFLAKDF